MIVERQTPLEEIEALGNTEFEVLLYPGFTQTPKWGAETWELKNFQVTLLGTLRIEDPLELQPGQSFSAILGLRQFDRLVWSTNIDFPLQAIPGSLETEFTFKIAAYVDLQNALPYTAAMPMQFVIFGVTPGFKKPMPEGE